MSAKVVSLADIKRQQIELMYAKFYGRRADK